jgi:TRAP-type C4-dicarboxylate transport system permease large subunit
MVIYGIMTEQSIGALFAAGVIPGIVATLFYMLAAAWVTKRNPSLGPPGEKATWAQRLTAMRGVHAAVAKESMLQCRKYGRVCAEGGS